MADDFVVDGRSNDDVRLIAKKARKFFDHEDARRVDVVDCLRRATIWTVKGVRPLVFESRPDMIMGSADGLTTHNQDAVLIQVKQSVLDAALNGIGRARNTLAHEMGHAVMHDRMGMPRRDFRIVRPNWIKPFESGEHQANVFAPAFLINDDIARDMRTAEEIAIEFGVSFECAQIYLNGILASEEKIKSKERVQEMADSVLRELRPSVQKYERPKLLSEPCTQCGRSAVFPIGAKFMCDACNHVFDQFQDGDRGW